MALGEASDRHESLTRELNEERAAALLRISRTLESLIHNLHIARVCLVCLDDSDRAAALSEYRALHARARQYRWYLEVQREALGLRHHQRLDEFYTIPPLEP